MLERSPQLFCALLLALAAIAGYVDAAGFVLFDNVFVANMTGNSVMLGIATVTGRTETTVRAALALLGFLIGSAIGTLFTDRDDPADRRESWPVSVTLAILVEAVLLIAVALGWAFGWFATVALVFMLGITMGLQSAAARKLAVPAVSTVVLTSTLTAFVARLIRQLRHLRTTERPTVEPHKSAGILFGVWIAYVGGAAAGSAMALLATRWTFTLSAALAVAIAAVAALASRPAKID